MSYSWLNINLPTNSTGFQSVSLDGVNIVITDTLGMVYYTTKAGSNNSIMRKTNTWTQKPGGLRTVSSSIDKIVAVDYNNDVWYSPSISTTNDWIMLTSIGGKMSSISYNSGITPHIICGIRTDLPNTLSCNIYSNNTWIGNKYQIPNTLYGSVCNGNLYIINSLDNQLMYFKNITTQPLYTTNMYSNVTRPNNNTINFKQIDFNSIILVALDTTNNMWYTYDLFNSSPKWYKVSSETTLSQISVNKNNNLSDVCGITTDGKLLYGIESFNGTNDGRFQTYGCYPGSLYRSSDYGKNFSTVVTNGRLLSGNWISVSISSNGQYQSAVSQNGQLYTSNDFGNTWLSSESTNNRLWNYISMSSNGQYQTAVVYGGQIYTSKDYGQTWIAKDSNKNWNCVSLSLSGQYQTIITTNDYIYLSSDYGQTWTNTGTIQQWTSVSLSSSGQYQTSTVSNGQIYVSNDYGQNWSSKDSNRNWKSVSISSSGQYQTAVVYGGQIYISNDYGQTWYAKESNRNWSSVSISSNGQYQTAVSNDITNMYISNDYGQTWVAFANASNKTCINVSKDLPKNTANPSKVIITSVAPNINSINLSYKIPDGNGNPITKYKIKSYYNDINNNNKCGPSLTIDMINTNDPYYNLLNKSVGTNVTLNIPNITNNFSFTGTPTNLPSCEPYESEYNFVSHIPITKEPYIFTISAINSIGESEMSEKTTQDIVPIIEQTDSLYSQKIYIYSLMIFIILVSIIYYINRKNE